ncbi:MAG: FAD/NAD(P)-binding protein, partial [Mucilaginibacter sp.]
MKYDIVFVGSGMACVTTLTELCNSLLQAVSLLKKPVDIAVVEKQPQFWAGVPYGDKSSVNCLTITTYAEFLNDPAQFEEFNNWLIQGDHAWINEYLELGGSIAADWYSRNRQVINAGQIATIAIPRYLYGKFKREQLHQLINKAHNKGLLVLNTIKGEAISATKNADNSHTIGIKKDDGSVETLLTEKQVLTTGNMPYRKNKLLQQLPAGRFIQTAYEPGIPQTLAHLQTILAGTNDAEERNLLLIGSNASSIELLYLLTNHKEIAALVNKIVVLSPGGKLPLAAVDTNTEKQFIYFDELDTIANCHPDVVFETMIKEFGTHFNDEICTSTVQKLLARTRQLLSHLSDLEFSHFLMDKGPEFSKLIRRSIADYLEAVIRLNAEGKLEMLPGKLAGIDTVGGKDCPLLLRYQNGTEQATYPHTFSAVIGCSGFETFDECTCPLINDVLNKGLCTINNAGIGIEVNSRFEASANLYVTGPLVAGTVNDVLHYWHLENLSRLL